MRRRLFNLCLMALMGVLMVVSKEALAFLPNVELVSLLIILFTVNFGFTALGGVLVFILLEGLLYGFGQWFFMYLYVWPLLFFLSWFLRRIKKPWVWAIISGAFGLAFGTLCSISYLPIGGFKMMISWIISGFTFDLIHGVSNFLLAILLFKPLSRILEKLRAMIIGRL